MSAGHAGGRRDVRVRRELGPPSATPWRPLRLSCIMSHRSCLATAALFICITASACGSSVVGRARAAAPAAIAAHLADAREFDASQLVDVPVSTAWNATVDAVQREVPIADASFADRRLSTHWTYEEPAVRDGVATQRRVRHHLQLTGDDARSFRTRGRSEAEARQRETCSEPTEWRATAPTDATAVTRVADEALDQLREVPLSELRFPGSPEDVLPIASDVMLRRVGLAPSPDGIGFPLRSAWRESQHAGQDVALTVRSAVTVRARPADGGLPQSDGISAPAVHLDVEGSLQWHGEHGEEGTAWVQEPADPIVRDFVGRLAERLPPLRVARREATPVEPRDPEPRVAELPRPPDPLSGRYQLSVPLVTAPLHDPNGLDWDATARVLQTLIEWAPAAIRVARVLAGDPTSLLELAVQLYQATRREGLDDRLAAEFGRLVGQAAAPDLSLQLALPGGTQTLPGRDNSHVTGWTQPLDIVLRGAAHIEWVLVDRDIGDQAEEVARGTISVERLANACERVCESVRGAQVCFELRRVR